MVLALKIYQRKLSVLNLTLDKLKKVKFIFDFKEKRINDDIMSTKSHYFGHIFFHLVFTYFFTNILCEL